MPRRENKKIAQVIAKGMIVNANIKAKLEGTLLTDDDKDQIEQQLQMIGRSITNEETCPTVLEVVKKYGKK